MAIRDMASEETSFLREMLYTALAWRPGVELPSKEWVLDRVSAGRGLPRDWGRDGDTALVGEESGRLVGAVWYRYFTETEHGAGYVDDKTPELAITGVEGSVPAALVEA